MARNSEVSCTCSLKQNSFPYFLLNIPTDSDPVHYMLTNHCLKAIFFVLYPWFTSKMYHYIWLRDVTGEIPRAAFSSPQNIWDSGCSPCSSPQKNMVWIARWRFWASPVPLRRRVSRKSQPHELNGKDGGFLMIFGWCFLFFATEKCRVQMDPGWKTISLCCWIFLISCHMSRYFLDLDLYSWWW